ncbi:ABC transporter permease [Streptococcus hongkongensis]
MSILKRSLLYISRKKRKSLTLFLTLWLVATALISGIAVRNAAYASKEEFSKHSETMLHIASNQTANIGDGYGSGEIPEKSVQKIAKNSNVARVNSTLTAYASLSKEKMVTRGSNEVTQQKVLFVNGSSYSKDDSKFTARMITLKKGRHIEPTDRHVMMVHEEFAKINHLKVGDILSFGRDPLRNAKDKSPLEAKIVGIFKGNTTRKTNNPYEMLENTVFSDEQFTKDLYGYKKDQALYSKVTIFPKENVDGAKLQEAIKKESIPWDKYELTAKDSSLVTYAKSIDILNKLVETLQLSVVIAAIVLVSMALFFWIGGRTHETGILLAIGQSKIAIVTQYALEVIMLSAPAFLLSAFSGQWLGKWLGDTLVYQASLSVRADFMKGMGGMNLGADSETDMFMQTIKKIAVQVSSMEIITVLLTGLIVILIAIVMTSLIITCYKPREILSKMS